VKNIASIFIDKVLLKKKIIKIINLVKASRIYNLYVLRDDQPLELNRWFKDNGDETLRLDYPELNEKSIVLDLGGYEGDFAQAINKKYKCKVYLFEPHPKFYKICLEKFSGNDQINVFNYGLLDKEGKFSLSDTSKSSSFFNPNHTKEKGIKCQVKEFFNTLENLQIYKVDLMKINIEGGEFPLLQHIASRGKLNMINQYQIQFHKFIINAVSMRKRIIAELNKTHKRTWCYNFVWENWKKIETE